jgi:hypothetical protein
MVGFVSLSRSGAWLHVVQELACWLVAAALVRYAQDCVGERTSLVSYEDCYEDVAHFFDRSTSFPTMFPHVLTSTELGGYLWGAKAVRVIWLTCKVLPAIAVKILVLCRPCAAPAWGDSSSCWCSGGSNSNTTWCVTIQSPSGVALFTLVVVNVGLEVLQTMVAAGWLAGGLACNMLRSAKACT